MKRGWVEVLLAALFSFFTVGGTCYALWHTLGVILSPMGGSLALAALAGLFFLYRYLLCHAYAGLEKLAERVFERETEETGYLRIYFRSLAFLLLCYGFYLLLFYPGSLVPDGRKQLSQGLFLTPLTNMHPYLLSLAMGALCRLGMGISDNFGFFLVVCFLALLEAACYAAIPCFLKRWGVGRRARTASVLFLGLFPPFGAYAQTLIKDGLAAAFTALFFTVFLDVFRRGWMEREKKREAAGNKEKIGGELLALFLLGALVCLTRRNGSYLVLSCLGILPFWLLGKRRLYGGAMILGTLFLLMGNQKLGDVLGVERASMRVYYSVLFQQTARFYREYPEEVTKKERKRIAKVLEAENLGELYNPELSDPVKNTFREAATAKQMKKYLKVWLAMGKRHPLVYADAFLEGCYGYVYPFRLCEVSSPWYLDRGEAYSKKMKLSLSHLFSPGIRTIASVFAYAFRRIPPLWVLVTPGFYAWVYLFLAGYLLKRKRGFALWPFLLPLCLWGVCILSPVNGCVRYFLPLMGSLPSCLFYVLGMGRESALRSEGARRRLHGVSPHGLNAYGKFRVVSLTLSAILMTVCERR